jgi:hypothetical protein
VATDVGELFTKAGFGRDAAALIPEPEAEVINQRFGADLAGRETLVRRSAPDFGLDPVELCNPTQALGGNFGPVTVEDFFQLAPRMRPAKCQRQRPVGAGIPA